MFDCEELKAWLLCIKDKLLVGIYFYNYQTLLQDICCFRELVAQNCSTTTTTTTLDCPATPFGLDFTCVEEGEGVFCFTVDRWGFPSDVATDIISYSYDGINYTELTAGETCVPACQLYVYGTEHTSVGVGVEIDAFTMLYNGTVYTFDLTTDLGGTTITVVSMQQLQDALNALLAEIAIELSIPLQGFFVCVPSGADIAIYFFPGCQDSTSYEYISLHFTEEYTDGNDNTFQTANILPFDQWVSCIDVANRFWLDTCLKYKLTIIREITYDNGCPAETATYNITDFQSCDCYTIVNVVTDETTIMEVACQTFTTTVTTLPEPTTRIYVEILKQVRSYSDYALFTSYDDDMPSHARAHTSSASYDSGWLPYTGFAFNLPLFDPTDLVNNETFYFDVSFDGGATIASTYTFIVLTDLVTVAPLSNNLYNVTLHPNFVACFILTPYILAEYKTGPLVTSVLANLAIGVDFVAGASTGDTAIGFSYCCLNAPPPAIKYFVVVDVKIM